MKKIILLYAAVLGLAAGVFAQKKTFLRLYDISGYKFAKGFFAGTTENAIMLTRNDSTFAVPYLKIGVIKTKRSIGNGILTGALIGAVPGAIIFAAGASGEGDGFYTYSTSEGIIGGFLIGAAAGALAGVIISASKKRDVFTINGKQENWLHHKTLLDKIPIFTPPQKTE